MDTTTAKASWTQRHPRLSAVLWALPYLAFLAFPLGMIPSVESPGLIALILTLVFGVAAADIAIYVVNPTPEWGAHIKKKMWISHGILLALVVSLGLVLVAAGASRVTSALFITYSIAGWNLQAPRNYVVPGLVALVGWEVIAILLPIGSIDALALSYAIIALLMVLGLTLAVRRSFDNRHSEEQRQRQAISLVRERERLRFAGELHDILGHSLTVITMKNELAQRLLSVGKIDEAGEQIAQTLELSRQAKEDLRGIIAASRSLSPEEEVNSARELCEQAGIEFTADIRGNIPPGPRASLAAHIIREGTANAITHAHPKSIHVRLTPAEVLVRNDGYSQKYSVASRGGGTGLQGLRERAASEGDVNWGSEGGTWELRLMFKGEAL
ncbi:sensor histidine kinase [uncultured Actinomyces sp.]|uniref:sensor histidine kinase n=1 Tax=uncultured Actinomyces sp. TaxID=249061 RepID=UPI00261BC97D|nr:histidine kinase [uncultured Actinomyces sp.]